MTGTPDSVVGGRFAPGGSVLDTGRLKVSAPAASLGAIPRPAKTFPETGFSQPAGRASRELRWGWDGASLKSASGYSVDPIGYRSGDLDLYRYCGDHPAVSVDPDGTITVKRVGNVLGLPDRGNLLVRWSFTLDRPAPADGYIVQEVIHKGCYSDGSGTHSLDGKPFWEEWFVGKGQTVVRWSTWDDHTKVWDYGEPVEGPDQWVEPRRPQTRGRLTIVGQIKFFLDTTTGTLGDLFATPTVPPAFGVGFYASWWVFDGPYSELSRQLPLTTVMPKWWNTESANGEANAMDSALPEWDAISTPPHGTRVVQP